MSSLTLPGEPHLPQRSHITYLIGSLLSILGGLTVIGSTFLVWQTETLTDCTTHMVSTVHHHGDIIAFGLGSIGTLLVLPTLFYRGAQPVRWIGALIGWWLASFTVLWAVAQSPGQMQVGFYVAGGGVLASFTGGVLQIASSRPQSLAVSVPSRQWLSIMAAFAAFLGVAVILITIKEDVTSAALPLISLALLIASALVGAVALGGFAGASLPHRYRIIGSVAIGLALAQIVTAFLFVIYTGQNLHLCFSGLFTF